METKTQETFDDIFKGLLKTASTFFCAAMFLVFPLAVHNGYRDILEAKYFCLLLFAGAAACFCLLLCLTYIFVDTKERKAAGIKARLAALKKAAMDKRHLPELFLALFLLACAISTAISVYHHAAFWGNEGRYSGMLTLLIYALIYILVGRYGADRRVFLLFLASALAAGIFGMTDFFLMDILGFHEGKDSEAVQIFVSTFGNINTYTLYMGMVLCVVVTLFVHEKDPIKSLVLFALSGFFFMVMAMGCSDSGVIMEMALFGILPFFALTDMRKLSGYFAVLSLFCINLCVFGFITDRGSGKIMWDAYSGINRILAKSAFVKPAAVFFAALAFACFAKREKKLPRVLPHVWGGICAACILALVFLLVDINILGHANLYPGIFKTVFFFDDSWGNNRGYIWRRSMWIYERFRLSHKLFGSGPDTFGIVAGKILGDLMTAQTGTIFDNAHNEYLQLFVTVGPIALAFYLAFMAAAFFRVARAAKHSTLAVICAVVMAAYSAQALVNLSLPITAPIFWIFIALGTYAAKDKDNVL